MEKSEEKVVKETSEPIFYQEFCQGAIEVREDYIICYKNLIPFINWKKGRVSSIIFINDIQHVSYKGCGWLHGGLSFTFKHYNKPFVMWFGKWFFWRRKKLNSYMTPIYEYIKTKVINNNK